jgi:epoxyqueuosine reductase
MGKMVLFESKKVKKIIFDMGADLCGIAPADRFSKAPKGFGPTDIFNECRSVVVYAKKLPREPLFISNCIPYTYVNNLLTQEVDRLGLKISLQFEKIGIKAIPPPIR